MVRVDQLGPWIGLAGLTLTVFLAIGLAFLLWKGQAGPALSYLREANEALVKKSEESDKRAEALETKLRLVEEANTLLEARTSFEPMVAAVVLQFESHETRAAERHLATLHILEMIARRLGPDPNGNGGDH